MFTKPLFAWMHTEHFNKSTLKSMIQQSYSTTEKITLSGHTVNSVGIYTRQYPISLRGISSSEFLNKVHEIIGTGDLSLWNSGFFPTLDTFDLLICFLYKCTLIISNIDILLWKNNTSSRYQYNIWNGEQVK